MCGVGNISADSSCIPSRNSVDVLGLFAMTTAGSLEFSAHNYLMPISEQIDINNKRRLNYVEEL